jgi:hypothetical protein
MDKYANLCKLGALSAVVMAMGCRPRVVAVEPPTLVPTRTPGVMFVIVHPSGSKGRASDLTQPGDQQGVNPQSSYILLCDGRKGAGMRCEVATEAALRRYSYAPGPSGVAPDVVEGVGAIADVSVQNSEDRKDVGETHPPAPTRPTNVEPAPSNGGAK